MGDRPNVVATTVHTTAMSAETPAGPWYGPVVTGLLYDAAEPWQVEATFYEGGEANVWLWSREDLLSAVTGTPAGFGDALMWCDGLVLFVRLSSEGRADGPASGVVALPAADVERLLARSAELVPFGTEAGRIDMDAALRALLDAS